MSRIETDGCSELTCPYHGAENRRKHAERDAQDQPEPCIIPNTPCHLQGVRYNAKRCASACELSVSD